MGIELAPDELALRLNLVTVANGVMSSYSSGNITTEESSAIVTEMASVLDDETFTLYPGVAYRHILVVKGHPELLDTTYTPPHDISDRPVAPFVPKGPGADLLLAYMERSRPLLERSAANRRRAESGQLAATDVWPFWPGVAPRGMRPFSEVRGHGAAMTSGVDLLNGLAVLAGIRRLEIAGVTGGPDNDYAAQAEGALAALAHDDVVFIHVESPDEEGHAGDARGKVAAIEAIDREVVGRIRPLVESGAVRLLAMPDHPTPLEIKTHAGEPVPFVLAGAGIASNEGDEFHELCAEGSGTFVDPASGLIGLLLAP